MQVELWTLPGCPRCEEAKSALKTAGIEYVERDIEALQTGGIPDVDAMTNLVMCDGRAPMVRADGRFIDEREFEALLSGTD